MAEAFPVQGVPVFFSDVKGDLSGLAEVGSVGFKMHDAFVLRAKKLVLRLMKTVPFPSAFWIFW